MARRIEEQMKALNMPINNHLLVIGIDEYDEGFPKLNNSVNDAKRFAQILRQKYAFEAANIRELYNEKATSDRILDAFDDLRKLSKKDNLIIYYAGHGEIVEATSRGYWVPFNARPRRRGDFLNNVEVQDFIATCGARHILCIVDSCYSGSLLTRNRGMQDNRSVQKYYTRDSRHVMTSGLLEPVEDGLPGQHSPFARILLNELEHNPIDCISVGELWNKIKPKLDIELDTRPVYEPMFRVGHDSGEYFFITEDSNDLPAQYVANDTADNVAVQDTQPTTPAVVDVRTRGGYDNNTNVDSVPTSSNKESFSDMKIRLMKKGMNDPKDVMKEIEDLLNSDSRLLRELILVNSRYNSILKEFNIGIVSHSEYSREMNKIKYALGQLIDSLEMDDVNIK